MPREAKALDNDWLSPNQWDDVTEQMLVLASEIKRDREQDAKSDDESDD